MMRQVTARPNDRPTRWSRALLRAAAALVLILLVAGIPLVISGCGGAGSTMQSGAASSSHAPLSASDSVALASMVKTTAQIQTTAAAAANMLQELQTGEWLKLTSEQQLAALSGLESLSQRLMRTIANGFPEAQAADLQATGKGALTQATSACSDYISVSASAASNLIYLPLRRAKAESSRWSTRIAEKADQFAAAQRNLELAMGRLRAKYGG